MSLFPAEMESERLRYERLHPDDIDAFELYEHVRADAPDIEEITRYVTWEPYTQPKKAFDWIEQCGDQFEAGETATYVIRPKEGDRAGELAGLAGLDLDWDRRLAILGVWLRKPFWGRGYSGERAGRLLELAFDRLDLEVVAVMHDPENDSSRRAIEAYVDRFGGQKEGRIRNDIIIDGEPRDSIRYSISRAEWRRSRCE
ncbi:GNAT family N-acetyltransferase [Natronorubrum halophilum]|uniref:GNAT family N-acetyltransferase n=1 Tax=Natronorubrum halophilum TaxID=1702106 RepID=UPI0010C24218|nr:GNAT family protein [Natronorubrum halophilum]